MPRPLSCPVCRVTLPEGGTHCPRCGLRIAALPRRPRRNAAAAAALQADAAGTPAAPAADSDDRLQLHVPALHSVRVAVLWGAAAGVALVGLAAAIAALVSHGHDFGVALSNAMVLAGGSAIAAAVFLGGVRVSRLLGDVELMREKALHGPRAYAHHHLRLSMAAAGIVPLGLGIALAFALH